MRSKAVARLDQFAREHYGKRVIDRAVRWVLDRPGVTSALWRTRQPEQLASANGAMSWKIDAASMETIDHIVRECVADPVGPEFMAPPTQPELRAG